MRNFYLMGLLYVKMNQKHTQVVYLYPNLMALYINNVETNKYERIRKL